MGLFKEKKGAAKVEHPVREEPSEATTTPANVPPLSAVPDGTDVTQGKIDSRPIPPPESPAAAEEMAKEKGWFSTVLKSDVQKLAAKGIQPEHVEGPRMSIGRDHKLFVYAMSPEEAQAIIGAA